MSRFAGQRAYVDARVQDAYRAYIGHLMACPDCKQRVSCANGVRVKKEYRAERDAAGAH
ncbi:hypothetical protein [Streptomyces sp. NPDC005181]|uniref:hypothetical protein n=1 Tax=Streptomyces sp. NPDC005181 TaxID=3156869 RepID=UPI0033BECFDD